MITSEMIYQNLIIPGKTQKVLELVGEIHQAQATLQEKLFQLDGMINDRGGLRKLPQVVTNLLPGLASKSKQKRTYRKYNDEFRNEAVDRVLKEGRKFGEVVRELDLTPSLFRSWIKAAKEGRTHLRRKVTLKEALTQPKLPLQSHLPPKVLSAYNALSKVLNNSKDPVPVAKLMSLPEQSKAATVRALAHLKKSGDALRTQENNKVCYEWNRSGDVRRYSSKRSQKKTPSAITSRPLRAPKISFETNPLYNDLAAIALREEMKTTKRSGRECFSKEFREKLRVYAHEKYYTHKASTGQIAHSLGVSGPTVQRWLRLGIYAKTKTPMTAIGPTGLVQVHEVV